MKSDSVREIKDRIDIYELVSDYVRLKKAGKNYCGLCPFHDEKTPSFYVSPERQTYHCFGCGAGGDIFSFIMEKENLEFREALEMLAARSGVTLDTGKSGVSRRTLYDIMEKCASFFARSLASPEGAAGSRYLEKRSVKGDLIKNYGIGWSPSGWDNLWSYLSSSGVSFKEALDCGLVLEGNHGPYDRFRGRVMFPVRDITGRVIAFGGRLVDGQGAKYINSPEGVLFHKRSCLYLIERAKKQINSRKRAIIVEGYMDALRLHESGFKEAVASLGTSLTDDQARLLRRLTDRVYICFDPDAAGQDATIRGMYLLQKEGLEVFVVSLPEGKDPDELLISDGGEKTFTQALSRARPLIPYHLYIQKSRLSGEGSYQVAVRELLEGMAGLPMEAVIPYINQLSRELQILPHHLQERIMSIRKESRSEHGKPLTPGKKVQDNVDRDTSLKYQAPDDLESALCYLLWEDSSFRKKVSVDEVLPLVRSEDIKMIVCALISGEDPLDLEATWHSTGEQLPMKVIAAGGSFLEGMEEAEKQAEIIISALKKRKAKSRFRELGSLMIKGVATEEEMKEYIRIKQESKHIIF